MATISIRNLRKEYDKHIVAVSDFNLDVQDGEFIVLVGPSGCGKTTTLYMIAGLESITSGEIYVDKDCINNIDPKDRDIAMVFQSYALYPHLTVEKNLEFPLRMHKVPRRIRAEKVKAVAEILDIKELLKRKPHKLSGGQQQRVAIGKAIIREPKLFLMDEPLANLDVFLRNQMRVELIKLHKQLGVTFVYVTHDQVEALTLGTRVVVMKDGIIQQVGTPKEVFENPSNMFVASFIGLPRMNFVSGCKLFQREGLFYVAVRGVTVLLDERKQRLLRDSNTSDCDVTIGIRPDQFIVSDESGFDAVIEVAEFIGTETYLHVSSGEVTDLIVKVPTGSFDETTEAIKLGLCPDSIYLFDSTSEKMI